MTQDGTPEGAAPPLIPVASKLTASAKSLTHQTVSGLLWMFLGSGLYAGLRIVTLLLLARLLTPEEFGVVGAAMVVGGFALLLSQAGMEPALIQRPTLEERHVRTALTAFLLLSTSMGALVALASPLIARFFRMDELVPLLLVTAFAFPLQGLMSVPTALLKRRMQFRGLAAIQVVSYGVGYGGVGITLAWIGAGAWSLVVATLAQSLLAVVLLQVIQPYPKRPLFDRAAFGELMYFGTGFTLARLLNYVALQGDNLVVGRWLGAAALGLYSRAYQLLIFPVDLFGTVMDQVLFPSMARVQHDSARLATTYRRGVTMIGLVFLPLSTLVILLAPELVLVLLGPQWLGVVLPFKLLALSMLFRASYKMSDALARATGAVYSRAWRQGIYAGSVVGGALVGQLWGVAGVAAGTALALLVNFTLMAQLSLHLTSLTWGDLLRAHRPALWLTIVTLGVAGPLRGVLQAQGVSALVTLVICGGAVGLVLLLLIYLAPRLALGEDGLWMVATLRSFWAEKRLNWGQRQTKQAQVAHQPLGEPVEAQHGSSK